MSLQSDLLEQAKHLAKKEPRRPKQASLRRAVSAAYYAIFHLLVGEATQRFVTGSDRDRLRQCLGRAFSHVDMKSASTGFAKANVSNKVLPALRGHSLQVELKEVATAFVELQEARHAADYDTARRFTRQEANDIVQQAERAFSHWNTVRGTLPGDVYLVSLLALKQIRE